MLEFFVGLYVFIGAVIWFVALARHAPNLGVKALIYSLPVIVFGWPYVLVTYRDLWMTTKR